MSRLNGKASEVLDTILSLESPEVRAKVYEIINVSGLEADDPMFLILALTGQMRVFLEAAPTELSKLLTEWKESNAQSLDDIYNAISLVQESQQQQADTIAQKIEKVSNKCVSDLKKAGSAATSAIADANSETLAKAIDARDEMRRLKHEIQDMYARVLAAQQHNQNFVEVLSDRAAETIASLLYAKTEIDSSHERIHKLTVNSIWARLNDWFSPAVVLAFWGAICLLAGMHLSEYLYPRSVKLSGRELMDWNLARLIKCQKDKNPKCTFWIVPPELRK